MPRSFGRSSFFFFWLPFFSSALVRVWILSHPAVTQPSIMFVYHCIPVSVWNANLQGENYWLSVNMPPDSQSQLEISRRLQSVTVHTITLVLNWFLEYLYMTHCFEYLCITLSEVVQNHDTCSRVTECLHTVMIVYAEKIWLTFAVIYMESGFNLYAKINANFLHNNFKI